VTKPAICVAQVAVQLAELDRPTYAETKRRLRGAQADALLTRPGSAVPVDSSTVGNSNQFADLIRPN